jgi:hypothetical protein
LRGPRSAKPSHSDLRPPPNLLKRVVVQTASDFNPINLRHARGDLEDPIGQRTIRSQQNQPGGRIVEPSHGKNAAGKPPQQVPYGAAPFGVGHGRNHVRGLVQHVIFDPGRLLRNPAGSLDAIRFGIGLRAKFRHHDSVDAHLSAQNQFFGVPSRGDPRPCDDLL